MTTATISADLTPVQRAVVDEILDDFGPLKWLTVTFELPGGGIRCYQAWTAGGDQLGDQIDDKAINRGLNGADWLDIINRHCEETRRGNVKILAHDLPPIGVDVDLGHGTTDPDLQTKLRLAIADMADASPDRYRHPAPGEPGPGWGGVGPRQYAR